MAPLRRGFFVEQTAFTTEDTGEHRGKSEPSRVSIERPRFVLAGRTNASVAT